ncbi:MAG: hypothetical protein H7318_12855 [Oligoflexus sp.]|nr:hypothetical protein [Oligoflexus sp.]
MKKGVEVIVKISKKAQKQLLKLPSYIVDNFYFWKMSVETFGMSETRKTKGWNDHPLKGDRKGQRSVYLNDSYRAIYIEATGEIIEVIEVMNHRY